MRVIKFGYAVLICAAAALNAFAAHASASCDTIKIYPEKNIKSSVGFGCGGDWNGYSYVFNNSESLDASEKWIEGLKQWNMKIPVYRMGGDSSNGFYWKTKYGELSRRTNSDFDNKGYIEWYKALARVNADVQLNVVFNMNDTAENNADLVRFLTLAESDPNAVCAEGINWASVRAEEGVKNPIPVFAFELGNELYPKLDYTKITVDEVTAAAERYVQSCRELISAVRAVNPEIKLAAQTYSSSMISYTDTSGEAKRENELRCRAWNETVISALKEDIDFAVHHDYFNGVTKTSKSVIDKRDEEYRVITDYTDGTDIKILLTESGSYISGGYGITESNSIKYALGLGRFYIKAFSMESVAEVIQYGFNGFEGSGKAEIPDENGKFGGEWWTSYRYCKDGIFRPSANGAVGNLFAHMSDGIPVITEVENESTVKSAAQAFKKADGGINIVIVPDADSQNDGFDINIELPGYRAVKMTIVSGGENETADNNSVTPNGVTSKLYHLDNVNPILHIPKNSAAGIEFIPADGETVYDGVGEMRISKNGNAVEITDCFYDTASTGANASLLILREGAEYPDIEAEDIAASDTADIIDSKAFFETEMPYDASSGRYTAVIGSGNTYHAKEFVYGKDIFKTVTATCENGRVTADVSFGGDAANGTYTVTAIYGAGNFAELKTHRFAYLGTFEKSAQTARVEFDMPAEALSGAYTLIVGGGDETAATGFEYTKNGERVVIDGIPTDSTGAEITGTDGVKDISFRLRNISEERADAAAYACSYKDGYLLKVSAVQNVLLEPGSSTEVSAKVNSDGAELIKLIVWEKNSVMPYTSAYYIK